MSGGGTAWCQTHKSLLCAHQCYFLCWDTSWAQSTSSRCWAKPASFTGLMEQGKKCVCCCWWGERNKRPMPQKGLATWGFFHAGKLDVSERKAKERKLLSEQQEWGEIGRAPLQARGITVNRSLCGTGWEEGGLLADRGGWWRQAVGKPIARQEDQVRVLLLGFVLSEQADKACKATCIEFQSQALQHNTLSVFRNLWALLLCLAAPGLALAGKGLQQSRQGVFQNHS